MRKNNTSITTYGGAYDSLGEVRANRGLDLQLFVDHYVEHGVGTDAFFAAGGDGSNDKAKRYAYDILKVPQVQQAITEKSAQKFFALTPVAVRVLHEILTDTTQKAEVRAKIAMGLMDKVQVEKHNQQKTEAAKMSGKAGKQFEEFMGVFNEFARKNPEWQSIGRGNGVVIDADVQLPDVEEHQPE